MKRFYKDAGTGSGEGGHTVLLDGRPIRTPGRNLLALPTAELARAVAAEWAVQGETIRPESMGITRLASTVTDQLPERRDDAIAEIQGYAEADLLCYRAGAPSELAERQAAAWQPWLDWAARRLDAPLLVTTAIDPLPQPAASLEALRRATAGLDDWHLVGLHATTRLTGSIVLGHALLTGELDPATAFDLALLEELFEIERWGLEAEQARRHATLRADLAAAEAYCRALPH